MSNRASKQRCEQAAREAARFEATGDLVVVIGDLADHVDPDSGHVLHLSPAWERVFERPVAALVGQPFRAFLGDSRVEIVERASSQSDSLFADPILLKYADPDTGPRMLEGHAHRALEDPGSALVIFRDVTVNWTALAVLVANVHPDRERRVVRSQRLESLGALAGGFAHAFNNFLTPIVGNVNLALLDLPATSPIRKRIEMIRGAADRATALTRQMLAYAGQDASKVNAIDLTTAVDEMTLLTEATSSGSTRFVYALKPGLPLIEVDSQHLGQVLLNLVANACESFPKNGGRVEISTGSLDADRTYLDRCRIADNLEKGEYVYLEVCDDGSGIPEEDLERIFEPHFTTRPSGGGLGLTAIAEIVRRYRGALELMSKAGEGTRVRVLFPTIR